MRKNEKEAAELLEMISRAPLEKRRMVRSFILAMLYLAKVRKKIQKGDI